MYKFSNSTTLRDFGVVNKNIFNVSCNTELDKFDELALKQKKRMIMVNRFSNFIFIHILA